MYIWIWYIYINIVNDNSQKIPLERYVWKEELRRKNNFQVQDGIEPTNLPDTSQMF